MGDIELDTRVEGEAGRYRALISKDWDVWGPNGGYLAAIALRAAAAESRQARPIVLLCHFVRPPEFAPAQLAVRVLRRSSRAELLAVTMTQSEQTILEASIWSAPRDGRGLEHDAAIAPDVPPPDDLRSLDEISPPGYPWHPYWTNVETKPVHWMTPDELAAWKGGDPVYRQWQRYRTGSEFTDPFLDACRCVIQIDTIGWPAATSAHREVPFVGSTLDLSVHFHRTLPESSWLLADGVAPVGANGWVSTRGQVWSMDGRLVASGMSQLLCRALG